MENNESSEGGKNELYIIIGILAVGSLAYRLNQATGFSNTSILFVGIPALLSILIIKYTDTPKSPIGMTFKVITLFLLISGIILGEGIICIIMAAPIFYLVGFLISVIYQHFNKKDDNKAKLLFLIPLLFVLMQPLRINEKIVRTVSQSMTYNHPVAIDNFSASPDFQSNLPLFFQIGFPKPLSITGNGMNIGDQRSIEFLSSTKGHGTLTLEIAEKNESSIHFIVASDNTHMSRWLTWHDIQVEIASHDDKSTVTWTTDYTCDLGPQWYFEPIEQYGVQLMNKHLMQSYFSK